MIFLLYRCVFLIVFIDICLPIIWKWSVNNKKKDHFKCNSYVYYTSKTNYRDNDDAVVDDYAVFSRV